MSIDLVALTTMCFRTVAFRSLDLVAIGPVCKLRRIFTMRGALDRSDDETASPGAFRREYAYDEWGSTVWLSAICLSGKARSMPAGGADRPRTSSCSFFGLNGTVVPPTCICRTSDRQRRGCLVDQLRVFFLKWTARTKWHALAAHLCPILTKSCVPRFTLRGGSL